MNILIVGLGEVGYHIAKVLSEAKHSVTAVDPDVAKIKRVGEVLDVQTLVGDGTLPRVLDEADASSMDLVLAVTNSDRSNMLTCLLARRMGAESAIVRVRDLEDYRNYRTLLRKNILFDEILSLEDLAAEEIAKIVRRNQAVALENFLEGQVTLRVLRLKEKSPMLGQPLKDIKLPGNVLVVATRRDGTTSIPDGAHEFQEDDEVYALGKPSTVEEFEAFDAARSALQEERVAVERDAVAADRIKAAAAPATECARCHQRPADVYNDPCGHKFYCSSEECSPAYRREHGDICPVCKDPSTIKFPSDAPTKDCVVCGEEGAFTLRFCALGRSRPARPCTRP